MAFRKELLQYVLPFPQHLLVHDFWIGIVAEHKGSVKFIQEDLIKYRIHPKNTSAKRTPFLFRFKYRIQTLVYLIVRLFGL